VARLIDFGVAAAVVPDAGLGAAAVVCDLVLVEAVAAGPTGILATMGSHAAAAVASQGGTPVWAVAGVGRVLPARLWEALLRRLDDGDLEPWDRPVELVPASLLTDLIGPSGQMPACEGLVRTTCPAAPELLRHSG
jgi:hypothetical protein